MMANDAAKKTKKNNHHSPPVTGNKNYMIFHRVLIAQTSVHRKFKKIDQLIFKNANIFQ